MKSNSGVTTQESKFNFDELFFSQTDPKGIILTGNSVFQRVSEYVWDEIKNQPHNLIRHPDMPKGVFFVLWKYLQSGKPLAAFVKNRSKFGNYYWVFALAMPIEGGFLSVRLKPSGDLLRTIEAEYQKLRKIEQAEKISPEESSKRLVLRIQELGYQDYSHFMTEALIDQIAGRAKALGLPVPSSLVTMIEVKRTAGVILEVTKRILSAFVASKFVPLNLEIFSQNRGDSAATLSVVAHHYQKAALEITEAIQSFEEMSAHVSTQVSESQFYVGAATLLIEVCEYLKAESGPSQSSEYTVIERLSESYMRKAFDCVRKTTDVLRAFTSICGRLNTLGLGLELVRITGKIELSRIDETTEAGSLLESLRAFQNALQSGLAEINDLSESMSEKTNALVHSLRKEMGLRSPCG